MSESNDELFALTAVQLRLLTPQQVQECRAVQKRYHSKGHAKELAQVALELGRLTPQQIQQVLGAAEGSEKTRIASPPGPASEQVTRKALRPAAGKSTPAPEKKKPRRTAAPAPEKKSNALLYLGLSFVGCVLIVGLVVGVLLSGSSEQPEAPGTAPASSPAPAPKVAETPKPAPPPPPPAPPKSDPKPAPPKPAPPQATEEERRKADFLARRNTIRAEGLELYEEIKVEIEEELREVRAKKEARAKWLASRPITVKLRDGRTLSNATVTRFSPHLLELKAGGEEHRLGWDDLEPDSIPTAAERLFDPKNADAQFDRGRFLIARRDWARALEAFKKAADLDLLYESDLLDVEDKLKTLASGEAAFFGATRRVRSDVLMLKYDFRDPQQVKDFHPPMKDVKAGAVLDTAKEGKVVFLTGSDPDHPPIFLDRVSMEMNVTPTAAFSVILLLAANGGHEVEFGPEGVAFKRLVVENENRVSQKEIAKSDKRKLRPGKTHQLRLLLENRKLTVYVDGKEALKAEDADVKEDAPRLHGRVGFRVPKGTVTFHDSLTITAPMDPSDLQHRVGNLEVLLRRSLDKDLVEIRERRIEVMAERMLPENINKDLALSSNDPYFDFAMSIQDLSRVTRLRNDILRFLGEAPGAPSTGFELPEAENLLEEMIGKYPGIPTFYYLRALINNERQYYERGREDIEKALELFPDFAEALVLKAGSCRQRMDLAGAKEALTRALESNPDYGPAYVERAFLSFTFEPGNPDAFERDLKIALALDPANGEAISLLRILRIQSKGPKDLGCRFDYETEHYRVTTDISDEAAKAYGERLEAGFRYFVDTWKEFYSGRTFRKPRVAIFKTAENYYTYFELISESRGEHTGGVFRRGLNELVFFESIDREETYHRLHHEAFHHFMTLLSRNTPPYWFNEGTADYMGAVEVEGDRVVKKGILVPRRLRTIKWMLQVDAAIPFKKIMIETPREFYGSGSYLRYCQAWSMTHFFFEADGGKHRPLINRYFKALKSGVSPQQAFDTVMKPTVSTLEKAWKKYVLGLEMPSR